MRVALSTSPNIFSNNLREGSATYGVCVWVSVRVVLVFGRLKGVDSTVCLINAASIKLSLLPNGGYAV